MGRRPAPRGLPGRALLALLAALVAGAAPAGAQEQEAPGSELTVFLLTMGPGDAVWERFGHNAIWIRDRVLGTDVAYNYGLFDFDQDGFVVRLVRGHMLYWMAGWDAGSMVESYAANGRSVYAQELNLPPERRRALKDFLEWNARPENSEYRYDYYRDNCSTRVRDALDLALGGELYRQLDDVERAATYRTHTQRLTADDLPVSTGLLLALGSPVDHGLTAWEESFIPMELRAHVRRVRVSGPDGEPVPLVAAERTLFEAGRAPPPEVPPGRVPGYLLVGVLAGGLLWWSGRHGAERRDAAVAYVILGVAWSLLAGSFGTVIAGLWGLSDHWATYANQNVLQANPLSLLLVPLIPIAIRRARSAKATARSGAAADGAHRAAKALVRLAGLVVALAALGVILALIPIPHQRTGEIVALAAPLHVGLWLGARGIVSTMLSRA